MFFYDIGLMLFILFYLPLMFIKGKGHRHLSKRFGFFEQQMIVDISRAPNIWIHAVSVGEVYAAREIIQRLSQEFPSYQIVLTVSTKTGHALAKKVFVDNVCVLWAPVDLYWVVKRFIRVIDPIAYIAVETELWPNQFRMLHERGVPTMIVNGRISDKAWPRYQLVKGAFRKALAHVQHACVQSKEDAQRFQALGVPEKQITVLGNVKWDGARQTAQAKEQPELDFIDGLVWVAGSTFPGEEELVLDTYRHLVSLDPLLKLILVPRHVERADVIEKLIERYGFECQRYSREGFDHALAKNTVLLVDVIGHLKEFYVIADMVFVGKSMCVGGGQNVIEPAAQGKAVVVGPMMQNFKEIMRKFLAKDAVIQLTTPDQLTPVMERLLQEGAWREQLGRQAQEVVALNAGVTDRTMSMVRKLLNK